MAMPTDIKNTQGENVQKLHQFLVPYCQMIRQIAKDEKVNQSINNAIKTLQSLRGHASFMQWHIIELLAASNGKLLSHLRNHKIKPDKKTLKVIALSIKVMFEQLTQIEKTGEEKYKDYDKLIDMFEQLTNGDKPFTVRLSEAKFQAILDRDTEIKPKHDSVNVNKDIATVTKTSVAQTVDAQETQTNGETVTVMQTQSSEANMNKPNPIDSQDNAVTNHFFALNDGSMTLHLNALTLLANLTSCLDLLTDNMAAVKTIECDAAGLNKPTTSLLQFLLCLHRNAGGIKMTYTNISDEFSHYAQFMLGEECFI